MFSSLMECTGVKLEARVTLSLKLVLHNGPELGIRLNTKNNDRDIGQMDASRQSRMTATTLGVFRRFQPLTRDFQTLLCASVANNAITPRFIGILCQILQTFVRL